MLDALIGLIAPPLCVGCRGPGPATPLCAPCRRALRFLAAEDPCPRCALPRAAPPWKGPPARHGSPGGRGGGWDGVPGLRASPAPGGGGRPRAHVCPAEDAPWDVAFAPVAYAGPAVGVVAALKDRGARACADAMAAQIVAAAPAGLLGTDAVLVPVPTHPWRARRRGYDQADLLARALAERTGLPRAAALGRRGPPTRQRGATRAARLGTGRIALVARGPAPPRVALVDDVHTTGATLRAAAIAIRAAGARDVGVLTWARTL